MEASAFYESTDDIYNNLKLLNFNSSPWKKTSLVEIEDKSDGRYIVTTKEYHRLMNAITRYIVKEGSVEINSITLDPVNKMHNIPNDSIEGNLSAFIPIIQSIASKFQTSVFVGLHHHNGFLSTAEHINPIIQKSQSVLSLSANSTKVCHCDRHYKHLVAENHKSDLSLVSRFSYAQFDIEGITGTTLALANCCSHTERFVGWEAWRGIFGSRLHRTFYPDRFKCTEAPHQ